MQLIANVRTTFKTKDFVIKLCFIILLILCLPKEFSCKKKIIRDNRDIFCKNIDKEGQQMSALFHSWCI